MNGYEKMCTIYGIKPMSLDEEVTIPTADKKIRENKIKSIDTISLIYRGLNSIENRVRNMPEDATDVRTWYSEKVTETMISFSKAIEELLTIEKTKI